MQSIASNQQVDSNNNNILSNIDERLYELLKSEMNTDEQMQFIESFKMYLKYGDDDNAFVIDFDNVWKWIGFTRKDNAKTLLLKKFNENIDYIRPPPTNTGGPLNNQNGIKEIIMLSVNTFKKFCIKALTSNAEFCITNYLQMENLYQKYTVEQQYSNKLISSNNTSDHNVLSTIDDRLYVLMKEELNSEEQMQFVDSFKLYLKYGYDDTAYVIDFDDIWKWVGFSQKGHAKTLLLKKFKENEDYIFDRPFASSKGACYNQNGIKETIVLTVNAFKKFCMVASTKRADEICNYYIKMEKIMHQYTNEKLIETQSKLNKFIEYDEELFWNENEINDFNNKNVLYIAFIGIINNDRIYKFGKSEQIYTREFKQHQKFFNTFKMRFVVECDNMSIVEKEFKKFIKSKNLLKNIEIKQNNLTELFTITEQQNIAYIIENMVKLVETYPLPAIKKLQDEIAQKNITIANIEKSKQDEIIQKNATIDNLTKELTTIKQKLYKYHASDNKIQNEIIENVNNIEIITKDKTKKHQGPYVQVYNKDDITNLLTVYPSITEATRLIENASFTQIKFASTNKLEYLDKRWFLVDRTDCDPYAVKDIGETVVHKQKKIGLVAMLNLNKDTVLDVYMNQKEAADAVNQCSSAICVAVKYNKLVSEHFWALWDNLNVEMQNNYLLNNILPTKENTCSKAVRIEQIDPTTNARVKIFATIVEVCKELNIAPKTIKKYAANGETYKGFKYNTL